MPRYAVGLDLGQASDYSALAVTERIGAGPDLAHHVRHLQRFALGTPYPAIVPIVVATLRRPPLAGNARLVIDRTGVGAAVYDLFRASAVSGVLSGITITGGEQVRQQGRDYWIPKRDLVAAVQVPLQAKRLKIAPELPEAPLLTRELETFRVTVSLAGHDSYGVGAEWREGSHDDLVLAVAMALWATTHIRPTTIRSY